MMSPRVARVFPRRTTATPADPLAFVGPPGLFVPDVDEVHVSVAFTWDLPEAESLVRAWSHVAPVKLGGPATGARGQEFIPGRYLADGYVITSRGCPNRCWFCEVWRREGMVRELPIVDGFNVLDDNILACSDGHIKAVFAMLARQPGRCVFTGGLEAARLTPWVASALVELNPVQIFFAYDTPDDWDPLVGAADMMRRSGWCDRRRMRDVRAYVLCGFPGDTMPAAETRMREVVSLGLYPCAMLWTRDGKKDPAWGAFQRQWFRPAAIASALNTEQEART
jgi:hypothetical protein